MKDFHRKIRSEILFNFEWPDGELPMKGNAHLKFWSEFGQQDMEKSNRHQ